MASEVDIVNLSLAGLGDDATVSSINPPEGSAQAAHAARFYPMARDTLLEMHAWGFATRRASLALLSATPPSPWAYAYATPSDMNNPLNVYASDATDDIAAALPQDSCYPGITGTELGIPQPQPYIIEVDADGNSVIYTNQENAVLMYTAFVTDTTKFSPLFIQGLTVLLRSFLAGPVLKGDVGRAEAKAALQEFNLWFGKATTSDANQRRMVVRQSTPWMANR